MLPYKVTESISAFRFLPAKVEGSEDVLRISDGAAERQGSTLAAGRGPRKGLRTKERRGRREDGGE
jgi:hypothetical protein